MYSKKPSYQVPRYVVPLLSTSSYDEMHVPPVNSSGTSKAGDGHVKTKEDNPNLPLSQHLSIQSSIYGMSQVGT